MNKPLLLRRALLRDRPLILHELLEEIDPAERDGVRRTELSLKRQRT